MQSVIPVVFVFLLVGCSANSPSDHIARADDLAIKINETDTSSPSIQLDRETESTINHIIKTRKKVQSEVNSSKAIEVFSAAFLARPYVANRLIGSANIAEELVVDFDALDCFTYLDYVDAFRTANNLSHFVTQLIQTRYVNGIIDFNHRKHFLTDWAYADMPIANDITSTLSPQAKSVTKQLNQQSDGRPFIPALAKVKRNVTYIPREAVDSGVIRQLNNGDYIGIYTHIDGLDVTHAGLFLMTEKGPVLRHASSRKANNKVIDSPFLEYVRKTPGIIVLRAK